MTKKDHRRSTEWEGDSTVVQLVKGTHEWRRSMKGKCNGLYMGTKCMMMAVNRRWIVFFLRKNKSTLKEGDMPKRRKYDVAVWKK